MDGGTAVGLSLDLLQGVLAEIHKPGTTVAANTIGLIEGAVEKLLAVKSDPVTFGELESFKITPNF